MVSPHIIQDSDDEGDSDFSPVKAPSLQENLLVTPAQRAPQPLTSNPTHFAKVWAQQLDPNWEPSTTTDGSAKATPANIDLNNSDGTFGGAKNSSSIPDPVVARVLAQQRLLQQNLENLSPLTEVSTPAMPSSPPVGKMTNTRNRGPQQAPNSAEAKVYGKKRRTMQSSPDQWPPEDATPLPTADLFGDASPVPAKKRRKNGRTASPEARPIQDDVDMVLVPMTEEAQNSTASARKGRQRTSAGTIIEETQHVLEVSLAPNTMSSSQKKLYQTFTSSTENADGSADQLPVMNLPAIAEHQVSSGAGTVSTVPFTTPSEFASPGTGQPHATSQVLPTLPVPSARKRKTAREQMPPSSPDIITQSSARTKTTVLLPQSSVRNDSWDSEDIGFARDHYKPRPSKRRMAATAAEDDDLPDTDLVGDKISSDLPANTGSRDAAPIEPDQGNMSGEGNMTEPIMIGSSSPQQPVAHEIEEVVPKQPKKRGRKKKEPVTTSPPGGLGLTDGVTADPAFDASAPAVTQPGKKKRGRPKKSETKDPVATPKASEARQVAENPSEDIDEFRQPEAIEPEPAAPTSTARSKKRGKSKVVKAEEDNVKENLARAEFDSLVAKFGVLEEKSSNIRGTTLSATGAGALQAASDNIATANDVKENEVKEAVKNESKEIVKKEDGKQSGKAGINIPGQAGKVPLRVGLSKRSRIAPLLKIVRKP